MIEQMDDGGWKSSCRKEWCKDIPEKSLFYLGSLDSRKRRHVIRTVREDCIIVGRGVSNGDPVTEHADTPLRWMSWKKRYMDGFSH
jgi:hypothetical protein